MENSEEKEVVGGGGGGVAGHIGGGGRRVVCVTGAGGFLGSWLVKTLLSKGYTVRGTVRDPDDKKNEHLKTLENSSEKLQFFKADLLDYDGLYYAIFGCDGVFHVASPLPMHAVVDPEKEIVDPAVKGTLNVLKASSEARVKRVVFVSTGATITMTPNPPNDNFYDERCWSDIEFLRAKENWYPLSKTMAEQQAWQYAKKWLGPDNSLSNYESGANVAGECKWQQREKENIQNVIHVIVDVRDVAEALILVYENSEATGRYICNAHHIRARDLVEILISLYPQYNYPKQFTDVAHDKHVSPKKLKGLGWRFRPLEETLVDAIQCFCQRGLLG
ncbi:unnamed protein product [Victoria cruziana]